jgi:hypothetical protein
MDSQQLRAILWLRWRLTRNQWRRSRGLGAIVAAALGILSIVGGLLAFAGGLSGGYYAGAAASPAPLLILSITIGGVFVFMWFMGTLVDLQRSEIVDVPRLLMLPTGLAQVFAINYVASHAAPSIVLAVPAMLGLALGAAASRAPDMLLLFPLGLSLIFCTTAWTYYLQGRVAAWMTDPRRRRFVVTGLSLVLVVGGQIPNLLIRVLHEPQAWLNGVLEAIGWPGGGLATAALLSGIGAVALWRAYRHTVRFYVGDGELRAPAGPPSLPPPPGAAGAPPRSLRLVERRVPLLSEGASAVATATLRSLSRAPEAALAFGVSAFIACVFGVTMLFRIRDGFAATFAPLALDGAMTFATLMQVPFVCNQFGFDRDGFRSLLLGPVDRRAILVGKNVIAMALGAATCAPLLGLTAVVLRPDPLVTASAVLQLAAMLLIAVTVGNALSIVVPYRVAAGGLRASNLPPASWLAILACHLFFPVLFAPALAPSIVFLLMQRAGAVRPAAIDMGLSAVVAAAAAALYAVTLPHLAELLRERETVVLSRVTAEHE